MKKEEIKRILNHFERITESGELTSTSEDCCQWEKTFLREIRNAKGILNGVPANTGYIWLIIIQSEMKEGKIHTDNPIKDRDNIKCLTKVIRYLRWKELFTFNRYHLIGVLIGVTAGILIRLFIQGSV